MNKLLPAAASERAKELLNGSAYGTATEFVYSEAGDYLVGRVIGRREVTFGASKRVAVLTVRVEEGQSGGETLEAGARVVLKCGPAELQAMVARFDPCEDDVVAVLLHNTPAGKGGRYQFSFNCTKATAERKEKEETNW
jgi:hypothetical protein